MYDLFGNGTPVIVIDYMYRRVGAGPSWASKIYMFVDGQYREVGDFHLLFPRFHVDSQGRIIVLSSGMGEGSRYDGVHQIMWNGIEMILNTIIGIGSNSWEFHNFITNEPDDSFSAYAIGLTSINDVNIPNRPLVPIEPLSSLQNEIATSVTQRLFGR